jgi:hypothetical protein
MSDNDIPENHTPDPGGPDPIDTAYVQAEALLSDDAARAARRARVLAAAEREPAAAPAASAVPPPWFTRLRGDWLRGGRRQGGWLAAACVAGLSVLLVARAYPPAFRPAPAAPKVAAPAASAGKPLGIAAPMDAGDLAPKTPRPLAPPPPVMMPTPAAVAPAVTPAAPPPPSPSIEPAPRAFPAASATAPRSGRVRGVIAPPAEALMEPRPPPPPPPPRPPVEVVVTAEKVASAPAAKASGVRAAGDAADGPDRASSSAGLVGEGVSTAPRKDRGARLRAAAAAGRTTEVETLLRQGAPIDSPDASGDTALMKSIQADHPAVAALLYRHGANPGWKNHAGQSARDMAAASGDAALSRAIGGEP